MGAVLAVRFWALSLGLLFAYVHKGLCLNMLTSPQLYNTGVGEIVTLSCEFRAAHFDLFNNPLLWTKTQRGEHTQVNIQSNVNAPFWKTNRFRVKYIPSEPIYRFELTISDLRREDNGNYTCEVRGQNSRVLANVTHLVMVRAPVESMFVSDGNGTAAESLPELVYTSVKPATLRCVADGAYPAPDLQLSVGSLDVGKDLAWKYTPLFEGPVGLRRMSYTVERWSHQFFARPEYDGHELLCAAVVPGLTVHTASVKIRVLYGEAAKLYMKGNHSLCVDGQADEQTDQSYPPIVHCEDVSAQLGMRNVSLRCVVTSRPRATGIRWFIDHNGTHFDVLLSTAFWASQKVLNSTSLQATLHLSHTGRRRFRPYTILAKNAVGETFQTVELIRNYKVPTVTKAPKEVTTPKTARYGESGSHYIFIISGATGAHAHTFQIQWTILALVVSSLLVHSDRFLLNGR